MTRILQNLQLDGGCLVFDFINTVNTRKPAPEFEYLATYEDFLAWSAKAGSLSGRRLNELREKVSKNKKVASAQLRKVIRARENLYGVFSAIAAGKLPEARTVNAFNERLSLAFRKMTIKFSATDAELSLSNDGITFDEPLNSILKSAFDVLTGEDFQRIKECPRCGWIFLDTSKNGTRRWCNMKVCGSRVKSLEYYYRKTRTS